MSEDSRSATRGFGIGEIAFGPMFAAEIRRKRIDRMRAFSNWRWHVDELFVKINGERCYLWRAVDHES
jgi:putative transposase